MKRNYFGKILENMRNNDGNTGISALILFGFILSTIYIVGHCTYDYRKKSVEKKATENQRAFLESNKQITGTVLKEKYVGRNFEKVPEKNIDGFFSQAYSNETVKLGNSKYTLKIKTDDGRILGVRVINGRKKGGCYISQKKRSEDDENIPKEALKSIVEEGSPVSFPKGNIIGICYNELSYDLKETYFNSTTQIGTKRADRIRVLPK